MGEPPPAGGQRKNIVQEVVANKIENKPDMLRLSYSKNDIGPYQVMIESTSKTRINMSQSQATTANNVRTNMDLGDSEDDSASKSENSQNQSDDHRYSSQHRSEALHIGRFSHLSVAKLILDMKLEHVLKIEKKGRNRLCIVFDSYKAANSFLEDARLLGLGYTMFIPANLVSCKGIVRFVDKEIDTEELKLNSRAQEIRVVGVKRLNRRVFNQQTSTSEFLPTSTVLFTFAGQVLPKFVSIYNLPMPVEPYILPVIQCQQCFLYGHTKKNCNGSERCPNCAEQRKKHGETCVMKCLHCSSPDHTSNSKSCPEFDRQKLMRQVMSFDNLSYFDANIRIPKNYKTAEYHPTPIDFPTLKRSGQKSDVIQVSERRNFTPQAVTYSRVARKRTKPSSPLQIAPGYDMVAHNACLINPNGRYLDTQPSCSNNLPSSSQGAPSKSTEYSASSISSILGEIDKLTIPEIETFFIELSSRLLRKGVTNLPNLSVQSDPLLSPEEY